MTGMKIVMGRKAYQNAYNTGAIVNGEYLGMKVEIMSEHGAILDLDGNPTGARMYDARRWHQETEIERMTREALAITEMDD